MQDLTQGSITRHILNMAVFIGLGLIFQTLYFLVDLYFVSRLGSAAIAGVSAAGVSSFLVMGFTQLVSVGAMALISQAIGRKDEPAANLTSAQALSMSLMFGAVTLLLGYTVALNVVGNVAADAATGEAGRAYLTAYLPSLALMFPMSALGSALRAAGVVRPTMVLQTLTVLLNIVLAPVLIAGWGTGIPLGVAGAGWASTISVAFGFVILWVIFPRVQSFVRLRTSEMAPRLKEWWRIFAIGLPAAGEFILMFVVFGVVYWVIRHFGPHAQAGFGVGQRIMQSIFLPAMAVAFAAAPIAGQNFGAGNAARVRATFRDATIISSVIMLALTLFVQWRADVLLRPFTNDAEALRVGVDYLRIVSWNFVATGVIFTCSSMFQGLGDTRPSLISSATRIITFAAPAIWLAEQSGTTLQDVWHVSVASVFLQAAISIFLLRGTLRKKLSNLPAPSAAQAAPAQA